MEDAIYPVNPLEDKSLVGFISISKRIIETLEFRHGLFKER